MQFLASAMVLFILTGSALAWYPSTSEVELGTATW
jgi:hypothetical protein